MLPARSNEPAIPVWGRWLIGSLLAVILLVILVASPHGLDNLAGILAGILPLILLACGLGLYFLPFIYGKDTPRSAAILVANLFFGWTGIGWVIVLIWAIAEAGTANARRKAQE